jgi:beta-N-acetylhexosaminidase
MHLFAIQIIQKPIIFDEHRVALTKNYIKEHYALDVNTIKIKPEIILIHHTGINSFNKSFKRFVSPLLPLDRPDISKASKLNVSTHFMIDFDGTIYQLMDETTMARHVIGLNYSSIGIENIGGAKSKDNLTSAQMKSNIELIKYLQNKYPSIKYLLGHYEYRKFENHELWLEKNAFYRTKKSDPSPRFMNELREHFKALNID